VIRVLLTRDAVEDLERVRTSGRFDDFLAKLLRIEDVGKDAGVPLGVNIKGDLTGWRKIVVGDRTWRILFRVSEADTLATVLVVGNRADDECYEVASRRLEAQHGKEETMSLAAALQFLLAPSKQSKRRRR
jgi:mRNA interferase RelE/StbE